MKKTILGLVSMLLLVCMISLGFNIQPVKSLEPPATEWSQTYGGTNYDAAQSVVQTIDGGFAIAGLTKSFGAGDFDFWLVKTNSTGHTQWSQTYGGTNTEKARSLVQTSDEGYVIAGETWSSGAGQSDFWLVKTDPAGNIEWSQTYGGTSSEAVYGMVQTGDGGYALAGFTGPSQNFWLVKTDSAGNMEWNQTYGGSDRDIGTSVVQTIDGGFAVAGVTYSFGAGNSDIWLIKTDASGNMEWNQTYGGTDRDGTEFLVQTSDGGYAIVGYITPFGAGDKDNWLIKTDASGNMEWSQTYGGTGDDLSYSLVETRDGGFAIAGLTYSFGAGDSDFWLVKTDSAGNMEWNQTYGGTDRDAATSVVQTNDAGYAIAGPTKSFGNGDSDFWLIKLASEEIPATVDIDPDTLNLKSNGQWVTAYITLPEGYNVEDIVLETVYLDGILAAWSEIQNDTYMTKFDRATVQSSLTNEPDYDSAPKFYDLALTVTGELSDGTPFQGSDTIRVLSK